LNSPRHAGQEVQFSSGDRYGDASLSYIRWSCLCFQGSVTSF